MKKREHTEFDWKTFEQEAIQKLLNGQELGGEQGVLIPLLQRLIQASLEGEIQAHVNESRPNRRNGSHSKTVKSTHGLLQIDMPRDRDGSFDSALLPKRKTSLGQGLDNQIIALYATGMSYSDIRAQLASLYGIDVSEATLSSVTDKVVGQIQQWQSRPLEAIYPFVWLDAIHYKVRHEGRVVARALYTVLALRLDGQKELLGLYINASEGARFWLGVLTELQTRGVKDIIVASVDGLKGFPEAIEAVFPKTRVQLCLVHQMRNSLKFVAEKDRKEVARDLKRIYTSTSRQLAEQIFTSFSQKWGKAYPMVVKSWQTNWDLLMELYDYPEPIRRIIYTTNPVESFHRQLRKVTKTKGAFVNDEALIKILFLAYENISKKWRVTNLNWGQTLQQLYILFPDRMPDLSSLSSGG